MTTVRTVWIASAVFFVGALLSIVQGKIDNMLMFGVLGFGLLQIADLNIDWQTRLTRETWRQTLFQAKWQTSIVGKLAGVMMFVCLVGFFIVTLR